MDVVELTKDLIKIPSCINNNQAIQDCINYCINYFKDNKKVFIKKRRKEWFTFCFIVKRRYY